MRRSIHTNFGDAVKVPSLRAYIPPLSIAVSLSGRLMSHDCQHDGDPARLSHSNKSLQYPLRLAVSSGTVLLVGDGVVCLQTVAGGVIQCYL